MSEPDRFEAKAREVWGARNFGGSTPIENIAAALRREASDALERAAQMCWEWTGPRDALVRAIRALIAVPSPEAPPATIDHMICPACGWSDAMLTTATGKLVCHRCDAEREYEPERVAKIVERRVNQKQRSEPVAPADGTYVETLRAGLEREIARRDQRIAELEAQIKNHRCRLPSSIEEALNSGDGTYKP